MRFAVEDLLTEFCYRVDNGEGASVHELFVETGRIETPQFVLASRDEIRQRFTARAADSGRKSRHYWTNARFSADGGLITVVSDAMTILSSPGTPIILMSGRSTDVFARHESGWAFQSRRLDGVVEGALAPLEARP
jgi:hypothetical protein